MRCCLQRELCSDPAVLQSAISPPRAHVVEPPTVAVLLEVPLHASSATDEYNFPSASRHGRTGSYGSMRWKYTGYSGDAACHPVPLLWAAQRTVSAASQG